MLTITEQTITHLYAPNPGGITDFVNVMLEQETSAAKLGISKNNTPAFFPDSCLLHYSGYGFAKRGTPLWLIDTFEK